MEARVFDDPDPGFGAGAATPEPVTPRSVEPRSAGSESGWSPRLVRLGAPRPAPAARRVRRFGVPLVPLLVATLVATAFLAARGGSGQGLTTEGSPGGDPPAVTPSEGAGTAGGRTDGASATGARASETPVSDTRSPGPTTPGSSASGKPSRSGPSDRPARTGGSTSPAPTRATNQSPAHTTPTPASVPTGEGRVGRPVTFEALRVGDCFDIDRAAPGTALRRACDTPHHAELVARPRLTGRFDTDLAVREAATLLCREPLRLKAARQPLGTRWTTFVQYPYRTSYLLGSENAACSLAAPSGGTLSRPLQ
ncbi:hypothetical protein ASE09_16280 [Streptomyces sp. Root66D1]|nr:hypothetical protein ASD33_23180 [Streptomyces sp. Root1304]KRA81019.1 hypothetical protein ASE09_16280 [Streptomyces sp. Root66D1]